MVVRVAHFSHIEKFGLDHVFLHYFWRADFKNIIVFKFDACFPFPLADLVLVYNTSMCIWGKNEKKKFSNFYNLNCKTYFGFWIYIKNGFFLDISCHCNPKCGRIRKGLKWHFLLFWPPLKYLISWFTATLYTSQLPIF